MLQAYNGHMEALHVLLQAYNGHNEALHVLLGYMMNLDVKDVNGAFTSPSSCAFAILFYRQSLKSYLCNSRNCTKTLFTSLLPLMLLLFKVGCLTVLQTISELSIAEAIRNQGSWKASLLFWGGGGAGGRKPAKSYLMMCYGRLCRTVLCHCIIVSKYGNMSVFSFSFSFLIVYFVTPNQNLIPLNLLHCVQSVESTELVSAQDLLDQMVTVTVRHFEREKRWGGRTFWATICNTKVCNKENTVLCESMRLSFIVFSSNFMQY